MTLATMADAAYAANIPPGFDIAAGYLKTPAAYHPWPETDWDRFPGYKLPIWVSWLAAAPHWARASRGAAVHPQAAEVAALPATSHRALGTEEGQAAVVQLRALGVPTGCLVAVDMEDVASVAYVEAFSDEMATAGYRLWVYGSIAFVFGNPPCNGYWAAHYATLDQAEADLRHPHVRAVQWVADQPPGFDRSLVKPWTEGEMWHG